MQLNTREVIIGGQRRWLVIVDGVSEPGIGYGSIERAFKRMDELWDRRPQSDRTLEALYLASHPKEF